MTRYLVKARLKPGKKSELAAHIKEGTIAEGTDVEAPLLEGLRQGRATRYDAFVTVDVDEGQLDLVREYLGEYLDVERVVLERDVPAHTLDDLTSYDPLPEWAGVDRD